MPTNDIRIDIVSPACDDSISRDDNRADDNHSNSNEIVPVLDKEGIKKPSGETNTDPTQSQSNIVRVLSLQHPDTLPSVTESERQDNDTGKKKQSHYYRNREKILAAAKLRYQENREKLLAYSKQYQSERKDQVKDRNSAYYEKHRERLLKDRSTKIVCACGKEITKGSLAGHLKTKYHLKRISENETVNDETKVTAETAACLVVADT
jgi:hypothetical protein